MKKILLFIRPNFNTNYSHRKLAVELTQFRSRLYIFYFICIYIHT